MSMSFRTTSRVWPTTSTPRSTATTPSRSPATTPTRRWRRSSRWPRTRASRCWSLRRPPTRTPSSSPQEFADENNLTTLSDLAALGEPIKLAAPADCEGRSDCEGGLTDVYGFDITEIVPLDFAQRPDQGGGQERRGRPWVRPARPTAAWSSRVWCCSRTTRASSRAEPHPGGQQRLPHGQPRYRGRAQRAVADAHHRGPGQINAQVDLERQKPEDVAQPYLRGQRTALRDRRAR